MHPEYTHFQTAVNDLCNRIKTRALEFELALHHITHVNSDGVKMTMKALKVRANYKDRQQVMNELLEALHNNETLSTLSNTKMF